MSFSSLLPRVGTAAVLIGLLALTLYMGLTWLCVLAFVFASLALWEFYSLFWPDSNTDLKIVAIVLCAGLLGVSWIEAVYRAFGGGGDLIPIAFLLCVITLCMVFLVRFSRNTESARLLDCGLTLFGLLYIVGPLMFALQFHRLEELLFLFAIPIATDTVAYVCGNLWGRHKIWPKVSPNKSVEGCLGGLLGCVLVSVAFGLAAAHPFTSTAGYALMGVVLGLAAMMGDFFESALKRRHDVKDSGSLLPGHGGILDRIDSFLFVVPAYVAMRALLEFVR